MNFPILSSLILLPSIGALFILFIKNSSSNTYQASKYVALFTSFANFLICGWMASGTSYFLSMLVNDDGIKINQGAKNE